MPRFPTAPTRNRLRAMLNRTRSADGWHGGEAVMKVGWWWLLIVPVVVLGLIEVAGDWAFDVRADRTPVAAPDAPPIADEVRRAFAQWTGPGENPTDPELAEFLQRVGTAAAGKRAADVADAFDCSRLHDEITQSDVFARTGLRPDPVRGPLLVRSALWDTVTAGGPGLAFDRVEVRKVVRPPVGGDLVVYSKCVAGNRPAPYRWGLTRTPGGWKIYDVEDVRIGMRLSRQAAGQFARMSGGDVPAGLLAGLAALRTATDRLAEGKVGEADAALAPARAAALPPDSFVLRCLLEGAVATLRGDHAAALDWADKADAVAPGLPGVDYLRASAHAAGGDWGKAALHARLYLDKLGPDAATCRVLGTALREMRQPAEARAAFEAGLRDDPTRADLKAAAEELRDKP